MLTSGILKLLITGYGVKYFSIKNNVKKTKIIDAKNFDKFLDSCIL